MDASYDYFFKICFLIFIQAKHQVLRSDTTEVGGIFNLHMIFFQSALDHLQLLVQTDIVVADSGFSNVSP